LPEISLSVEPETAEHLDSLAERFLSLQHLAAQAYAEAFRFDQPHEELKDFLIALASDHGKREANGSRILRATQYEIRLSFGTSNYFDPDRVCWAGAFLIGFQQFALHFGRTSLWYAFAGWVQSIART
jgi:hypothetical protein